MTLFPSLLLLTALQPPSPDQALQEKVEPNSVVIRGARKELIRSPRAGLSIVIRPEDETRFDTSVHLKNEANLSVPDTGRINASGFTLPRVRGQDSRFTEVYLNDLRIQDPYVGFPFIDDLDLRAYGEMAVYTGNPPPSLPTVSPNGAIAYRIYAPSSRGDQLGVTVGRPYGTALWAIKRQNFSPEGEVRIYARQHTTSGRYTYYDDNATPYNQSDDRLQERQNADRRGLQLLPTFRWQKHGHHLNGLGLWNDAQTSLPARLSGVPSLARESAHHGLGRLAYSYEPQDAAPFVPSSFGCEWGRYEDSTQLTDPTNAVLGSVDSSARRLSSQVRATQIVWQWPVADKMSSLYLRAEASDTRIDAKTANRNVFYVRRSQTLFYAGTDLVMTSSLKAELKASLTQQKDRQWGDANPSSLQRAAPTQEAAARAASAAISWQGESMLLYGQFAKVKRPPTLLEEFGDGALIRDNPGLVAETTIHREFGVQWRSAESHAVGTSTAAWGLRSSVFRDDTRDRVMLLPSIAQTMRAQNAVRTEIAGFEVGADVSTGRTTVSGGYARLLPNDRSLASRSRLVPGIAEHVATASLSQSVDLLTLRWATRYQSQVWRDSENTIAVPGSLIHDATIDARLSAYALGLGLYNVSNQQRLAIQARGTAANQGYTSYSDYAGMPLPGRQWRLNMSASF